MTVHLQFSIAGLHATGKLLHVLQLLAHAHSQWQLTAALESRPSEPAWEGGGAWMKYHKSASKLGTTTSQHSLTGRERWPGTSFSHPQEGQRAGSAASLYRPVTDIMGILWSKWQAGLCVLRGGLQATMPGLLGKTFETLELSAFRHANSNSRRHDTDKLACTDEQDSLASRLTMNEWERSSFVVV